MKLSRRVALRMGAVTLVAGGLVAGGVLVHHQQQHEHGAAVTAAVAAEPAGETAAMLANVQDASGAPLPGRDPSMEVQTSLEEAVSRSSLTAKPSGEDDPGPAAKPATAQELTAAGKGTAAERAAAGRRAAAQVLGDPKASGVLSNGCAAGYGRVDQCVPARAPGGGETTCMYVATVFPQGIEVTGKDTLGLDADGNGVACDAGDHVHQH